MAIDLLVKRGNEAQRSGETFANGEPAWTSDNKKLYVGDGSTAGGIFIGPSLLVIPHTWGIAGEIKVASGDTDFLNGFAVPVPATQTVRLLEAHYKINSGTSATVKLQNDGVDITGFTGMSVTTTAGNTTPSAVALSDNDVIAPVVTAVAGTPTNMRLTIYLEYKAIG